MLMHYNWRIFMLSSSPLTMAANENAAGAAAHKEVFIGSVQFAFGLHRFIVPIEGTFTRCLTCVDRIRCARYNRVYRLRK